MSLTPRIDDLEVKNKVQTKYLGSNATSTGVILTFNNLVIGRLYKLLVSVRGDASSNNEDFVVDAIHDGNIVARASQINASGISGHAGRTEATSPTFEATATTVTIDVTTLIGNALINGNGTANQTYAELTEFNNDYEITTDFT